MTSLLLNINTLYRIYLTAVLYLIIAKENIIHFSPSLWSGLCAVYVETGKGSEARFKSGVCGVGVRVNVV